MTTIKYASPVGEILLTAQDDALTQLYFVGGRTTPATLQCGNQNPQDMAILKEAKSQLEAYFAKKLKEFSLPLNPNGTAFRKKVWEALCTIGYGQAISYKELAQRINNPKAIRAVGGANHNNPISIIIPCHRVIGADGKLVGYGGGLHVKEFLLGLEGWK
ncbi:MAG: methylated-DNA--[protein]-cysteine S-methyltransferase [Defluviitaleaceae bacterium]|nr:methylated-DNA--[protein]-cysteine S-methyltransferase [Defluviitaleaceae bacterium]